MTEKLKNSYRPEIDGLRAFAVVAVIINHFNKDVLPSGYLGVDIFFVISGFVITSSIAKEKSSNFLEFLIKFYEKRIKRLIPALVFFVLTISIILCFFIPNPNKFLDIGIRSFLGLSNISFYRGSWDYFAVASDLNPFMHTWSLGVEEQFYFIFPFLFWLTGFHKGTQKGTRNFYLTILFLFIISLISFILIYPINQPAAYFLMPFRFWEIALGSLTFLFLKNSKNNLIDKFKNISPTLIFFIMVILMFLPLDFAIFSTTLVVFLTSILLISLNNAKFLYVYLAKRKIVNIGLMSYSLYLWHWGVLSISRYTIGIHWWSIPFQILFIYFLSSFSYNFVEKPLRNKSWSVKKWQSILKGISVLFLSSFSLLILSKPLKGNFYLGNRDLNTNKPYFQASSIDENYCRLNDTKLTQYNSESILERCSDLKDPYKRTLFFLGDSHNHRLWLGAEKIAKETNSNLFTFSAGATPFPSLKYFRSDNKKTLLKKFDIYNSLEKEILARAKEGDVVIITMRFPYYFVDDWYEFPASQFRYFDNNKVIVPNFKKELFKKWIIALENFASNINKKNIKLLISNPTPEFPRVKNNKCREDNKEWFNHYSLINCDIKIPKSFFNSKEGKYKSINKTLYEITNKYSNVFVFDAFNALCPNSKCEFIQKNKLLYTDKDHISNYSASNLIAPAMIQFLEKEKIINF